MVNCKKKCFLGLDTDKKTGLTLTAAQKPVGKLLGKVPDLLNGPIRIDQDVGSFLIIIFKTLKFNFGSTKPIKKAEKALSAIFNFAHRRFFHNFRGSLFVCVS